MVTKSYIFKILRPFYPAWGFWWVGVGVVFFLSACDRGEITVEQTPPDLDGTPQAVTKAQQRAISGPGTGLPGLPPGHPPVPSGGAEMLTSAPAGVSAGNSSMVGQSLPASSLSNAGNPVWEVPANWVEGTPSSMRRGSFAVKDETFGNLDISVTAFPGDVGGLYANLNRWRSQLGLAPASPEELEAGLTRLTIDSKEAVFARFSGPNGTGLHVILEHAGDSWFIKLSGAEPLAMREKENFLNFARSFRFPDNP